MRAIDACFVYFLQEAAQSTSNAGCANAPSGTSALVLPNEVSAEQQNFNIAARLVSRVCSLPSRGVYFPSYHGYYNCGVCVQDKIS
jgi:hypothetical protein